MAYTKKHKEICKAWKIISAEWEGGFSTFREWSEQRWAAGAVLKKIFPELPWAPDNAYWDGGHDPDAWTVTWSRQYRRTPAQTANPCSNCRSLLQCTKICPARARWWDAEVSKWRRR